MRKNHYFKAMVFAVAVTMTANTAITANAVIPSDGATNAETFAAANNNTASWEEWKNNWDVIKENWEYVSVTPGSNESEMNFAWYSQTEIIKFEVSANEDMSNPVFSETVVGTADDSIKKGDIQYYAFRADVKELSAGTYYYRVGSGKVNSFDVKDTSNGFSFIFVGDPQIGSSNSMKGSKADSEEALAEFYSLQSDAVRSDSFNWNYTLTRALEKSSDAGFVLSAGDQIQSRKKDAPTIATDNTFSEVEYTGFLSAPVLRSLPLAPTVGNHDASMPNYTYHFNTPNNSDLGSNGIVGGDYWFTYGNALFIMLNTQGTSNAEHKQFIEEAVAANPDSKWRFVTLHQDIYGSAEHSNEPEITNLRYELVPYFEENDIDVVFTGHDHAYSRTLVLKGGKKTSSYYDDNEDEYSEMFDYDIDTDEEINGPVYTAYQMIKDDTDDEKQKAYLEYLEAVSDKNAIESTDSETAINPEGILYLTANSSSGSKYYDLTSRMQSYIAGRWQEDIPTYSVVDITDTTFTINTYRTDTNEKIDTQFTIVKEDVTEPVTQPTTKDESSAVTTSDNTSTSAESATGSQTTSTTSNNKSDSKTSTNSPKTGVGDVSAAIIACGAALLTAIGVHKKRK